MRPVPLGEMAGSKNFANTGPNPAVSRLIPIDIAIATGLKLANAAREIEDIPLAQSIGRIIGETLAARLPLPNFNNSAMDGYAINTTMLPDKGPYRLKISGRMAAGDAPGDNDDGPSVGAIRILTGALVPDAYDAVIMQEKCIIEDDHVSFDECPPPGNNIRRQGEDCSPGSLVIKKSTVIRPHHVSILAAQGYADVPVVRKIRVAYFSTGSELKQPGEKLGTGQIYNSNRFALTMQLDKPYIDAIDLGTIIDDPVQLKRVLENASQTADVVITTGGVSVGDEDHMPRLVGELGGTLHVMKVAIKPGKPVTIGTIGKTIYIGLPGNPVAAFLNQILIGGPIVEKLAGMNVNCRATQTVTAGFSRRSSTARQEYVLARFGEVASDGKAVVEAFEKSGSASLMPLAHSDGFVVIPLGIEQVNQGDELQFIAHQ